MGGINILGNPPTGTAQEVWNFNKQWLKQAISRGDAIRVTADPTKASNLIYINNNNISFNSFDDVLSYMNSFDEFSPQFTNLGYFGKEIHTLINNGYNFNPLTNLFEL